MKLSIPLTGTIIVENPLTGSKQDPVRPIDIDLGNVSWVMESIDLQNEVMVIEVKPGEVISEPELDDNGKPRVNAQGNLIYRTRPVTESERLKFLEYAQELMMNHTKDELYQMSRCHRLMRPFRGGDIRCA